MSSLFVLLILASSVYVNVVIAASSTALQCAALETCYEGGVSSMTCAIATGECPPCMTFPNNFCYVQIDGSCPFGVDCSDVFSSTSNSNSSSSRATTSTADPSVPSMTIETSSASASQTRASSQGSTSDESADADSGSEDSDTVLMVAILAVALGVAVLAVVLRKLFLRARAANEEDQEEVPSPPGTIMTASFSSNGTSRDPGIMISRSAMGTDLSVMSKTSGV